MAKKERIGAQKDLDDLKFLLNDRQRREEAREKALYDALYQKNKTYNMYVNNTYDPNISDEMYALQILPRHEGFWRKNHQRKIEEEKLKARIKSNTELLISTKRENALKQEETADDLLSKAKEPLDCLKEFDHYDDAASRKIMLADHMGKFELPDEFDNMKNMITFPFGEDDHNSDPASFRYPNKTRLEMLEQMYNPEAEKLDQMLAENATTYRKYNEFGKDWINWEF